jgi:hypothetical protein
LHDCLTGWCEHPRAGHRAVIEGNTKRSEADKDRGADGGQWSSSAAAA